MAILNKHRDPIPLGAVYIGRGSIWGNPFVLKPGMSRDKACDLYLTYIKGEIHADRITSKMLQSLHNKHLVCYCAPARCHGETLVMLAKLANDYETGKWVKEDDNK